MRAETLEGVERIHAAIGDGLEALIPGSSCVVSDDVFPVKASDVPLIRMTRIVNAGTYSRPDQPVSIEGADTARTFAPKVTATQGEVAGTLLYDVSADFTAAPAVAVGDTIWNKTTEESGTVMEVEDEHSLVLDVIVSPGDEVEVHWPSDALKLYNTDFRGRLTLDVYASASAAYGSGLTIEELEQAITEWVWGAGRAALNALAVEVVDLVTVLPKDSIVASGLGSDFYRRSEFELALAVGAGFAVRVETVEGAAVTPPDSVE